MATTVRLYATDSVILKKNDYNYRNSTDSRVVISTVTGDETALFVHFENLSTAYKYKLINPGYNAHSISQYCENYYGVAPAPNLYTTLPFNVATASAAELWDGVYNLGRSDLYSSDVLPKYITGDFYPATDRPNPPIDKRIVALLNNGGRIYSNSAFRDITLTIQTANGTNKPYIEISLLDNDYHITADSVAPSSGYIDETRAKQFTWTYTDNGAAYAEAEFVNNSVFTFEWRVGSSGTTHSITGTKSGVTVPANTFPTTGEVQARLKIVDALGYTTYTAWNSYTTTDSTSTATALEPISTVETDTEPVTFRWQHSISTGTAQAAAELQYSTDNVSWSALGSVSGSAQSAAISLTGLPAGLVYWRVRTANTDGIYSAWSEPVSFVLVAAPATPVISVDTVPMSVISWQAAVQQAYRVTIDGESMGVKFGNASSYAVKSPLADGEHTASVEVQGAFGLWSAPATVTFTVANVPGDGITLTAESGIDAFLSWQTDAETQNIFIFRDNVLIGRAGANGFIDRLTAGEHEYYVLNVFANGNYSKSNTVNATSGSCHPVMADINTGEWLELNLSPNSDTTQRFNWSKTSVVRHVSGAAYPVIELSAYEDKYASYIVAFKDMASAAAFEALKGKVVIVKSRSKEVVIGAITQLEKIAGDFFITYDFTIQRINWEDYNEQNA